MRTSLLYHNKSPNGKGMERVYQTRPSNLVSSRIEKAVKFAYMIRKAYMKRNVRMHFLYTPFNGYFK